MTGSVKSGRASARPARQPVPEEPAPTPREADAAPLKTFLDQLGRTGSVTLAATRARLDRRALYRRRASDEAFAAQWDEALNLGINRLQDDALQRALHGTRRPLFRNGKQVGAVQQYDNKLLQFLLRAHRPEVYGERRQPAVPPLPFDLAQRLAASAPRLEAHLAERRREEEARQQRAAREESEEPKHDDS